MSTTFTLCAQCPDRPGIIAAVSGFIAGHGGSICEASQHLDPVSGWFFMRYEIRAETLALDLAAFRGEFQAVAGPLEMQWFVTASDQPKRVVILASRQDHCLADLLYRWRSGDMRFELPAVISNHDDLRPLVEQHGVPFHHVPVRRAQCEADFAHIRELYEECRGDVMVLARFMQVLPPALCRDYAGRIINIHHSFLPSFSGARPYAQAAERGVKIIGATCHYVTEDLDAGPIIEQDVIRVHHGHTADQMARQGRDVEKQVLARGLRYHLEDRVLLHGNRTIVFS